MGQWLETQMVFVSKGDKEMPNQLQNVPNALWSWQIHGISTQTPELTIPARTTLHKGAGVFFPLMGDWFSSRVM